MVLNVTDEGQAPLPKCLLNQWRIYLCVWWLLREHWARDQRHNRGIRGWKKYLDRAHCAYEGKSKVLILFRTPSGRVAPWLSARPRLSWSEVRTQIATARSTSSTSPARLGNPYTPWTSYAFRTRASSSKTRSTSSVATTTWVAKCTTSRRTNGLSSRATTACSRTACIHSVLL